jgi:hypothetical protein
MTTTEEREWLHLLRQLCRDGCTFSEAAHIGEGRYPTPVASAGNNHRRVVGLRPEARVSQSARKSPLNEATPSFR